MSLRRRFQIAALVALALLFAGLGVVLRASASIRAAFGRVAIRLDPLG